MPIYGANSVGHRIRSPESNPRAGRNRHGLAFLASETKKKRKKREKKGKKGKKTTGDEGLRILLASEMGDIGSVWKSI